MLVLALETTSDLCSVAVADDAGVIEERTFRHRMKLSQRLMGDIAEVLSDAGVERADLNGIAVSLGPGSFTGVRVGVTVAKVMADVLGVPLAGIPTLEALAWPYRMVRDALLVPVVRSRPGMVCLAFFGAGGKLSPLREGSLYTLQEAAATLGSMEGVFLCGEYAPQFARALREQFNLELVAADAHPARASTVATIAIQRLTEGAADDPIALVPIYAAPPPIHTKA
ncbi:MAG: tRNA (adenosine(37)-N6)-threonylcarbamoyltransferase complex dimerization subunit type 1 TsaB [Chthonomonadales bacterium]